MRIAGFCKLRDEIIKDGNLYRVLGELGRLCDGGVLCDDASSDGTREALRAWVSTRPSWMLLEVPPSAQSFEGEIAVKESMLRLIHGMTDKPDWILWLDGDESIEHKADLPLPSALHLWLHDFDAHGAPGVRMHYTQLWRSTSWARTDQGFDDGSFVKLWRYRPDLSFDTTPGTHKQQFPKQIDFAKCETVSPFEVVHWGNASASLLRWKAVQYAYGRGGVDRHIAFGHAPEESLATGQGFDVASWSAPHPVYRCVDKATLGMAAMPQPVPEPFTLEQIRRIRSLGDLHKLPAWFTVVVPAYNRAHTLAKALDSLLFQSYEQWVAVVLDDGSTDKTPALLHDYQERDPRIFYARYPHNRGGVAMNEIGMALACEWTEWWSRLGSDDWWGPDKLARDAAALRSHEAVYGPYTDYVDGRFGGVKNPPMSPGDIRSALLCGHFVVGWANVAARCDLLRRVREKFGAWADPRLRNCEDFLVNARIATIADWTYRDNDGALDAIWNAAPSGGASSPDHAQVLAADEALTRELIGGMR